MEGLAKLIPLHLVSGMSGGEVGPPYPGVALKLLGCKLGLLVLGAAEEPKLGLDGANPIIILKRFSCFGEGWRVGCQELRKSAQGLTLNLSSVMSSMTGV
jgi:hypothetical protein